MAPAAALVTGLGEQNAGFFAGPAFQELRIDHVRVVVPWDAALTGVARSATWLAGIRACRTVRRAHTVRTHAEQGV